MTTFSAPCVSSVLCQSGRAFLAPERRRAILEVAHQIIRNQLDALFRADKGFDGGPLSLQALLLLARLIFGQCLNLGINARLLVLIEFDPSQPAVKVGELRRPSNPRCFHPSRSGIAALGTSCTMAVLSLTSPPSDSNLGAIQREQ
jgi:hypothetical protein